MTDKEKKYFDEFMAITKDLLKYHKPNHHEDLIQEAFIIFPKVVERYEEEQGDFKFFAYRSIYHCMVRYMRKEKILIPSLENKPDASQDDTYMDMLVADTDLEKNLIDKDTLHHYFNDLNEDERKAATLYYVEGWKKKEILEEMGWHAYKLNALVGSKYTKKPPSYYLNSNDKKQKVNGTKIHTVESYLIKYAEVVKLFQEGYTCYFISQISGHSEGTVRNVIRTLKTGKIGFKK